MPANVLPQGPTWHPLITTDDPMGQLALEGAIAITETISAKAYNPPKLDFYNYEEALLYTYIALATGDQRWFDKSIKQLNLTSERAFSSRSHIGLFGGLSGLGWTIEHISNVLSSFWPEGVKEPIEDSEPEEEEDLNAAIDNVIFAELQIVDWRQRPYDLVAGLVGVGIYFLERLPRRTARHGLELIVDRLISLIERTNLGVSWHTGPSLLPEWQRKQCPSGYYNLGVAHGIPAILFFLNELASADVNKKRVQPLLEEGVSWLISHIKPRSAGYCFDPWIAEGYSTKSGPRLAWCYGDLGIAAILDQIARRSNRSDWRQVADEILISCLTRSEQQCSAQDPGLCHGAAGNAHIFHRLHQSTGNERCHREAIRWLDATLQLRRADGGIAGFYRLSSPELGSPSVFEASPAFLDGAIGVALSLLAAVSTNEPGWDRLLALSSRNHL